MMKQHLDWHFRTSQRKRDVKRAESRGWYTTPSTFLASETTEVAQVFPTIVETVEQISTVVAPHQPVKCAVCNEDLEKVYDVEMEEFVLRGVVQNGNEVLRVNVVLARVLSCYDADDCKAEIGGRREQKSQSCKDGG
jgi:hypothetical protein